MEVKQTHAGANLLTNTMQSVIWKVHTVTVVNRYHKWRKCWFVSGLNQQGLYAAMVNGAISKVQSINLSLSLTHTHISKVADGLLHFQQSLPLLSLKHHFLDRP